MTLWMIGVLTALGVLFSVLGWRWDVQRRSLRPDPPKRWPKVSVLVAAYKSAQTIGDTLASLRKLEYPNLELIVVNDSPGDGTAALCRQYRATCVENQVRRGKAIALNGAAKRATGEILFFVDSDTVVEPDALRKLVPWFQRPDIAAVAPKYTVKNRVNWLTKLIALEESFLASFFKIHMYFGSLVSFRGCGVAVRAKTFRELGGWPHTLVEDVEFSAKLVKNGHRIWFEPDALIRTAEPETVNELFRQRARWGQGAMFTFFRYWRTYAKNVQFHLYFLPYGLLTLAGIGLFFYQSTLALLPVASVYLLYTLSLKEFLLASSLLLLPVITTALASTLTGATAGTVAHVAILSYPEKQGHRDLLLTVPYTLFYFPMIMLFYTRGLLRAIRMKRRHQTELDFRNW